MNDLKNASQQEKFEKPKSPLSPTVTKFVNIPQNSRSFEQIPFEISLLIANSDARFKKS